MNFALVFALFFLFTQCQGLSDSESDLDFDQLSLVESPAIVEPIRSDTIQLISQNGRSFTVPIHLLEQSKVLKTQLKSQWGRPHEITLPFDDHTLEWIIRFLDGQAKNLSSSKVGYILEAAQYLEIISLMDFCASFIMNRHESLEMKLRNLGHYQRFANILVPYLNIDDIFAIMNEQGFSTYSTNAAAQSIIQGTMYWQLLSDLRTTCPDVGLMQNPGSFPHVIIEHQISYDCLSILSYIYSQSMEERNELPQFHITIHLEDLPIFISFLEDPSMNVDIFRSLCLDGGHLWSQIPSNVFHRLTFLAELILVSVTDELPQLHLPQLTFLKLVQGEMSFETLKQLVQGLESLKVLEVREVNVLVYPHESVSLQYLERLVMDDCGLNDLSFLTLSELPQLKELSLSHNFLAHIPSLNLPLLKSLKLEHCGLTQLSFLRDSTLPLLEELIISGNGFSRMETFRLPQLKWLYARDGQLQVLNFSESPQQLEVLDISNNPIEQVFPLQLPHLITLNMSNCEVSDLSFLSHHSTQLYRLEILSLSSNPVHIVPPYMNLPNLKLLNLDQVQSLELGFLHHELSDFSSLEGLILYYSRIYQMPPALYLPRLKVLNLSYCHLTSLSFLSHPKTYLPHLELLDVKGNRIVNPPEYLTLPKLIVLDISWCHLNSAQFLTHFRTQLQQLQFLWLNQNDIFRAPERLRLPQLKELNLKSAGFSSLHFLYTSETQLSALQVLILDQSQADSQFSIWKSQHSFVQVIF